MPRPSRVRRIAKWSGVVVCVVLLAEWAVNTRYAVRYASGRLHVSVGWGYTFFTYQTGSKYRVPPGFAFLGAGPSPRLELPYFVQLPSVTMGGLPNWIPSVVLALPTAYLFYFYRRDRCYPRGHCHKCGYDLQGNVSGVCPECGKEVVITP